MELANANAYRMVQGKVSLQCLLYNYETSYAYFTATSSNVPYSIVQYCGCHTFTEMVSQHLKHHGGNAPTIVSEHARLILLKQSIDFTRMLFLFTVYV